MNKNLFYWKFKTFKEMIYISFFTFFSILMAINAVYLLNGISLFEKIKIIITCICLIAIFLTVIFNHRIKIEIQTTILFIAAVISHISSIFLLYIDITSSETIIAAVAAIIIGNFIIFIFLPERFSIITTLLIDITLIVSTIITNRLILPIFILLIPLSLLICTFNHYFASVVKRLHGYQEYLRITAMTDSLTGAYTRKFLDGNVIRENLMLFSGSIIMLDIDLFKSINDTYGHPAGDMTLTFLVSLLRDQLRKNDYIIRSGGEEFLIICKNLVFSEAEQLAERLRLAVQNSGSPIEFTISVGVTNFFENEKFEHVNKRVDSLLYESKKTGRNKVSSKESKIYF